MPSRKALAVLFVLIVSLTAFSLISAQPDQPVPLPVEPGSTLLQPRFSLELLTNGGFEIDSNGDKLPDGWTAKKTEADKADKLKCNKPDKVVAYTGNCAFQFSGNPSDEESKLSQDITNTGSIVDGGTLTLSAMVDPKNSVVDSKIASLKVRLSDDSKLKLDLRLPSDATISGYTALTDTTPVSIPVGVFITDAKLDLRYGETSGKVLIDDVSLRVISVAPTSTPILPTVVSPTSTDVLTETSTHIPGLTPAVSVTPTESPTTENTATETLTATATLTSTLMPVATYVSITQLVVHQSAPNDEFGWAVSLSDDGSTAIVGADLAKVGGSTYQGLAYIFTSIDNIWIQKQKLSADDGNSFDNFGTSVSLSSDGNIALIGAPGANTAYIYQLSNGNWTQQQKLTSDDNSSDDGFGVSVSLSGDGQTALITASQDDIAFNQNQGSAYVFVYDGISWIQQAKLTADDGTEYDWFGFSGSLSSDGNTALIGANYDGFDENTIKGSAYVFVRNQGSWAQQQKLASVDSADFGEFGYSVSISGDGSTAVIGAVNDDVGLNIRQGAAYVFEYDGQSWTERQKLSVIESLDFGYAVSLSNDGRQVVIGVPFDKIGINESQGSVYRFVDTDEGWVQYQKLLASDGMADDQFGSSVSISGDGNTTIVGARYDDYFNTNEGSAWIFSLESRLPMITPTPTPTQ